MRHLRARRRYKFVLLFLFILCSIVLVENRIEAFVPDIKAFAELKAEEAMGGRVKLSIGSIGGGILKPVVLNDVHVKQVKGSPLLQSLAINNIRTNYRIWDLIARVKGGTAASALLEKGSSVYVDFSLRNGDIAGFAAIEGDLYKTRVSGHVTLHGNTKYDFTGSVDGDAFSLEIRPKDGALRAFGKISDAGSLDINLRLDHLKIRGLDVACDMHVRNRIVAGRSGTSIAGLEGDLETVGLALNYRNLPDLKTSYNISNGVVKFSDLKVGDQLRAYGAIQTKSPGKIDITILANNVSLSWLFLQLGMTKDASVITGMMNGKFTLNGTPEKMSLESRFDIRKGTMSVIDFDYLSANIKGELPFLKIEEARITRSSGYFALAGEFDVRKIGHVSFFQDIRLETDDGALTWDDWQEVRRQGVNEQNMAKSLTSDIGVRYKKYVDDRTIDASSRDTDQARLEYKLSPNESLGMMIAGDKGFFGFEHRDKF